MGEPWPEYKLVRKLGEGGSGTVDEVQIYGGCEKKLALKTVVWEGKNNAETLKSRALKEMAIMKKLWHPCLPKLYAFKSTPSFSQILMTQGECGDLQQVQGARSTVGFPETQVKLYAAEVLLALEDLHKNGIVYADLKPENVVLRPCDRHSGHVMLCDFDMSMMKADLGKFHAPKQENSEAQSRCVGTLEFCAPEIINHGMLGYSEVSDFWGLGVLIYELTFGRNPFAGHSVEQTMTRILSHSPIIPDDVECSLHLKAFIRGLLRHDPNVSCVPQTTMAALLWALSSLVDLDGALLRSPASAQESHDWLARVLLIHESMKQGLVRLEQSPRGIHNDVVKNVILILKSALESESMEGRVVCIACIGGLCEALCILGQGSNLEASVGLLQTSLQIQNEDTKLSSHQGFQNSAKSVLCCVAVCVSRVFKWVGSRIGNLEVLLSYSLVALFECTSGFSIISTADTSDKPISGTPMGHSISGHLMLSATWSLANMCCEILATLHPRHSWETIRAVARFSRSLQNNALEYIRSLPNAHGQGLAREEVEKKLKNLFLVVVKLIHCAFLRVSDQVESSPTVVGTDLSAVVLATRCFIRQETPTPGNMSMKTASALLVLEALGNLQFTRVVNQEYGQLVAAAVEAIATAPHSPAIFAGLFPELKNNMPSHGQSKGMVAEWEDNPMTIAKVMFFMRLTPIGIRDPSQNVAVNSSGQHDDTDAREEIALVVEILVSYAFSFLQHAEQPVRRSAHQFYRALLLKLGSDQFHTAERLAPHYIDLCLAKSKLLLADEFQQNIFHLAGMLPVGGLSLKYILTMLDEEVHNLIPGGERRAGMVLFQIMCKCLLWFPLPTLGDCVEKVRAVVVMEGGHDTMPVLYDVIRGNKDYTRKLELARFYIGLHTLLPPRGDNNCSTL